ncbi:hypothetical protein PODOV006v2_p0003 [Vibrio phage 15E36.1]|uniref:Uncharacterized protein n=1 Tax=Vibrio phage 15E36.1 TaxID=2859290 RepID=A0AAE8C6C3_9CAUD|nr:hypothetical protein PODOV006v2_p0003 [Vibrio phage 15E36.1]
MTTPLTGDIKDRVEVKKEGVTLHNMPVVAEASLASLTHVINNSAVSGKRVGSVVTIVKAGLPQMFQASGSEANAVWVGVTNGATNITPV